MIKIQDLSQISNFVMYIMVIILNNEKKLKYLENPT